MQIDVAGQLLGLGAQSWVHPGGQAEEEGCRVGWAEPELLGFTARRMLSCTQEVRQASKGHDGQGKATLK